MLIFDGFSFQGREEKLIEIYCENVESFCDAMQEILSKLAYKVCTVIQMSF
jgi:hypothetical protein